MPTICLVTSTHVSANPRLVKEADVLAEAGYQVHVVAADVNARLRQLDASILAHTRWAYSLVGRPTLPEYALLTLLQRGCRWLLARGLSSSLRLAGIAHFRLTFRLTAAATSVRASAYIGHNLAALPAIADAAAANSSRYAFDAEDFHTEELTQAQRDAGDQIAREIIERRLLPGCVYRTAASPLIAKAYKEKYGLEMTPVLNVFPISESPPRPVPSSDVLPRSLYWFSQTVGPNRGLEEIVQAMALLSQPAKLYLRGNPAAGYRENLVELSRKLGLGGDNIQFLPAAAPQQMATLASCYCLGLAVEPGSSPNNLMALSNKLFIYLLAGIPTLLSRTPSHEQIAHELQDAVILVDLHNPRATALSIGDFLGNTRLQIQARATASKLARERFNWDVEKHGFLERVAQSLACCNRLVVSRGKG